MTHTYALTCYRPNSKAVILAGFVTGANIIEAHIVVSRKRGILDEMRRDIKGATARSPR
jgi:hypothetical protein